jgi:chromodomain-helicase-DNA-binding protein 4
MNDSAEESDFDEQPKPVDYEASTSGSRRSSRKSKDAKSYETSKPPTPAEPKSVEPPQPGGMPSVEEVCATFSLNDVEINFTDSDYETLTSYKLFQQYVRPILMKENPKVSSVNF